ncbi:MAG: DnaJ domain-containing protein [Clostridiales bacterium]|nr:DnaJ domain-containing protein [Clostridiales bacterium]
MKNYYRILQVRQNATDDEIKRQFRVLAKKYHPDRNAGNAEAAEIFKDLDEAYNVLTDPASRKLFDSAFRLEEAERSRIKHGRAAPSFVAPTPSIGVAMQNLLVLGFNDGYDAGYDSAVNEDYAAAGIDTDEVEALRRECERLSSELAAAKSAVTSAEKRAKQEAERVAVLQEKIDWIKSATKVDVGKVSDSVSTKAADLVTQIKKLLSSHPESLRSGAPALSIAQQDRRKEIREFLLNVESRVELAEKELAKMKAAEDQKRKLVDPDSYFKTMDELAEAWAKKVQADKKLARPTKYGELGVLIWATDEEIAEAFARIEKRYANDSSEQCMQKLARARDAFETFSDPQAHAAYNLSIGYTTDMILAERRLIAENERRIEEHRKKLEERAFWAQFDVLYDQALRGDPEAQNALGEMYFNGTVLEHDYDRAYYWFREAFESHFPAAVYNLGVCYRDGLGTYKNESLAQSLFLQASILGYTGPKKKK